MVKGVLSMRKIMITGVLLIFLILLISVGWIIFQNFYNDSANRNENAAVQMVNEIRDAQLRLRPKFGRYLTFDELIEEKAISLKSKEEVINGYRFSLINNGEKFTIKAIPVDNK